ncbi:MAG: DNA polymerase III subunit gamma/tau [Candidatus Saccharibacteria bacterium]|nr:DNA polymerase III subunit gamma/tau [Candidatus Saccharibacteria bacterium]
MKALYRRYRPISLDTVIGQDQVVTPLREALKQGKISHAYLFSGPRGTGKTSIARIFAHEINNFKYELEDDYIDIIEIDAASNTGVDNIRDLREKAIIAPAEGKYKIYIIDEVHMLSKSAFNALLKIMEEPPEHVVFIMATTNPEKVPITITSRSQNFVFKLADSETMFAHLKEIAKQEKIKISDDALKIIIERGGGSFRDTISLLDQISTITDAKTEITPEMVDEALGLPTSKKVAELLDLYSNGDLNGAVEVMRELLNSGVEAESLAVTLVERISASPNPATLSLVSRLFDVQAPFAEAKLLVAILGNGTAPTIKKPVVLATAPVAKSVNNEPRDDRQEYQNQASLSSDTTQRKARSDYAREEVVSEEVVASDLTPSAVASREDFIDAVATKSSMLTSALDTCKLEVSNSSIDIYPTKMWYKILTSKNNLDILREFSSGKQLNIHDPSEKPEKKSTLSDIMGNVQEVNDDGGDPF